ncbi:MAG: acyltransferase [Rhizobiaceae bacterium]|nr:acyltransferase [Rhizobiaceae bacterium]
MVAPSSSFDRIATLDLLRLVAAVAVLFFHYLFRGGLGDNYLGEGYPEVEPVAIYGYLGVNLFFLISGFVIAWSAEGRDWQTFAVARFARLYPGFLACMVITWIVLAVWPHQVFPVSVRQLFANLLIFSPVAGEKFVDGVYWSIVMELIFYGWVALALAVGVFSRYKLQIITVWLGLSVINEFFIGSYPLKLLFLTEYGPLFASGVLIHHIASKGRSPEALMLLATAFLLSSNYLLIGQDYQQTHYGVSIPFWGLMIANVVIYLLLIGAVVFRDAVRPTPFIFMLGAITYPLYLLHQNAGYVAIDWMRPMIGKWPAMIVTSVAMFIFSWMVWRIIERPARRWIVSTFGPIADSLAARLPWPRQRAGIPAE